MAGTIMVLLAGSLAAQAAPVREPLPIDVALNLTQHNGRSPISFSPDGQWIAHTVGLPETLTRDTISSVYSSTGVSFAEGSRRAQARLTNMSTGEVITLGGPAGSSWGAVWSPDGARVAFYSDAGGQAGLWLWDKATRRARRFPGLIVRPFFGFELVRWHDGRRLVVRVLPVGVTIAQANLQGPLQARAASPFPTVGPDQPSVMVRRFDPRDQPSTGDKSLVEGGTRAAIVDLAVVDVVSGTVARVAVKQRVQFYAFSPDGRRVAYTMAKNPEPNTQQSLYDLVVVGADGSGRRVLVSDFRLAYGGEWSWAPNGESIAYVSGGQVGAGALTVVSTRDGTSRTLTSEGLPKLAGETPPLWSAAGDALYAMGGGRFWRIDAASGQGSALGTMPGWAIDAVVTTYGRPTLWTTDGGRTAWVTVRGRESGRSGIASIDLASGAATVTLDEARSYGGLFALAGSDATGAIAFVSNDQQRLRDLWSFDTKTSTARQVTRLNSAMDRYQLGETRVIEWKGTDGSSLKGALLLPPSYEPGHRLPLVVWVYGGSMGSNNAATFGLVGEGAQFNMQVLATRGYAVLFPDAPVRTGSTMTDILTSVLPALDAAVAQGYADADRIAVMGQSYGSFSVMSLITQTKRFKAAVMTAVVVHPDLLFDYLQSTGYYEQGQGNMGGTPWDQRQRYLDNSPIYLFDRIETPVLIGQGEHDGDQVSLDVFAALQRLGKPIEFRLYRGESHVLTRVANVRDFWNRRLEFLADRLDLTLDAKGAVVFDGGAVRPRSGR